MKIGLSTCSKVIDASLFLECAKAGMDCLEISLNSKDYMDFDLPQAARWGNEYGVELWSYHLPFMPFDEIDISSLEESMRQNSVNYLSELIKRAGQVGIHHYVIHASGEPIATEDRVARMGQAQRSLSKLAQVANEVGAVLCVEDLPRTCLGRSSYDICELLKADERLRVCFDTNHLLGEYMDDFIRKVGSKIVTTHISDYDFWNERHWLPGEGSVDWSLVYNTLLQVGYTGPWLYELGFAAGKFIQRERDLTPADFVRNAQQIFNGETPTAIGVPVSPLTFW